MKLVAGFVAKTAGLKEVSPPEKVFDVSIVRKAHATLQAKGRHPVS
jgi:hypothetical protein